MQFTMHTSIRLKARTQVAEVVANGHEWVYVKRTELSPSTADCEHVPATPSKHCVYSSLPTSPAGLTEALPFPPGTKPLLIDFLILMIFLLLIYKEGK